MKKSFLFVFLFIFAFFAQVLVWQNYHVLDLGMWADQAMYIDTGDPEQFNVKHAYAHPGGPLVISMMLAHKLFGLPYDWHSMLLIMSALCGLLIAGISILCLLLRDNLWWLAVFGTLSIHRIFFNVTPPSALVSLLLLFLCLLTLYIFEHREKTKLIVLLLWSFILGLAVATRADVGVIMAFFFSLSLFYSVGFRALLILWLNSLFVFVSFDPFMWFMPIRHIGDLIGKILFHYANFRVEHLWLIEVLNFSSFSLISLSLFLFLYFYRKGKLLPIPKIFGWVIVAMNIFIYCILLTADYQAVRYFMPSVLIFDMLLPLFLISLTESKENNENSKPNNTFIRKYSSIIIVSLLVGFQLGFFVDFVFFFKY